MFGRDTGSILKSDYDLETRVAYAKENCTGSVWLTFSEDGRYDKEIKRWLITRDGNPNELTPIQLNGINTKEEFITILVESLSDPRVLQALASAYNTLKRNGELR